MPWWLINGHCAALVRCNSLVGILGNLSKKAVIVAVTDCSKDIHILKQALVTLPLIAEQVQYGVSSVWSYDLQILQILSTWFELNQKQIAVVSWS